MSKYGIDFKQASLKHIFNQYQLLFYMHRVSKKKFENKEKFIQFCIEEISFRFWRLKIKRDKSIL